MSEVWTKETLQVLSDAQLKARFEMTPEEIKALRDEQWGEARGSAKTAANRKIEKAAARATAAAASNDPPVTAVANEKAS